MAITTQLARITPGRLSECRRSVAELDGLCSFELVPASEHLDLDWADDALIRVCERAGVGNVPALRRATGGDDEVNPAYRDHPYSVWEQPKALEPSDVLTLAAALCDIDMGHVLSVLPSDPRKLKAAILGALADFIGDPRPYITTHFNALRDFYAVAAENHLAVVVWRD
ncbi:hypothetical protein BJF79_02990 [Actinomadura sp. CNU-125]|uniref:hypothetical protein n=1 Tax=Actinomadura sp. CNU-125 TaxID=1904961 RepID=UPI00095FD7BF|nr:hypothetical protein [Actinomadura sp. CNU-125]OLT14147.1 hypothetical protein BJF79_02990 [Actinomadura sp. CNU-125]